MHLLTLLLTLRYVFAHRQSRCLYSLLKVGSMNSLFLGCPAPLVGTPVWGWHGLFSCSWEMQERWRGLTRRT